MKILETSLLSSKTGQQDFLHLSGKSNPDYALWRGSEDTDSFCLPFALLAAKILLPFAVDIRSRKPCLFLLLRWDG